MSKTKTCNKCGRNFIVHSLGEAIPDGCDNCYRTDHPVSKVPLGDCVVHNFYKGTNCVNCGYDQALDHPHPNPKDVETWMVSLGFKKAFKDFDDWQHESFQYLITGEQAQFFYTIHHTALTSFRDELLATLPTNQSERWHVSHAVHDIQCFRELKAWAVEDALLEQRKAIQTISERHGL